MDISILIPAFNSSRYIESTVLSIAEQVTSFDIEVILIDGKSTDNTVEIFKNAINKNKNITYKIISEKDNGMYDALNKGLSCVSSDILCYINSDDMYFDTSILDKVINFMKKNREIDFIYGNCDFVDEKGVHIYNKRYLNINYYWYKVSKGFIIAQPTVFWRKNNIFFNSTYKMAGDYDFFLKLFKDKKPKYLNITIAKFRIHGASLSTNQKLNQKELKKIISPSMLENFSQLLLKIIFKVINMRPFK